MYGFAMRPEWGKTYYFGFCIVLLCLAFYASLAQRAEYLGKIREGLFEDQTARTLKFARNWYRDGIANDYFLQLENPASTEFTELIHRVPYISFLPGTVLPVYLLALAQGREPDIIDVQRINLMTQFTTSLLLLVTVWLLSNRLGLKLRACASLLAGVSYIFIPFLLYEHQQVYYSDAALMLPYGAFICAVAYFARFPSRWAPVLYTAILTFFILVDWFGVLVGGVWALGQMIHYRRLPKQAAIALLPALCAGLFCGLFLLYQLHMTGLLEVLLNVASYRMYITSVDLNTQAFVTRFTGYLLRAYGEIGLFLIVLMSAYTLLCAAKSFMMKRAPSWHVMDSARLQVMLIVVVPTWLCVWLIPVHFYEHDFSPMRLAFIALFAGGALLPQLIASVMPLKARHFTWIVIAALSAGAANLALLNNQQQMRWFGGGAYPGYEAFHYVHDHAGYDDIIFSPNSFTAIKYPTQELAIAMRRIYGLNNFADLARYEVNDYMNDTMLPYAYSGSSSIILPEGKPKYLLVLKNKKCWPLSAPVNAFLKRYGKLVHDEETFAYYALGKLDYKRFDIPLCPVPK